MASTGETDRKRRHLSSISPTATAAMAKKPPFTPISEDKKIDTAVLQFQNQKLAQKLDVQKMEITSLEKKLALRKEKQESFEKLLAVVNNSWNKLLDDVEARSVHIKGMVRSGGNFLLSGVTEDGSSSSADDVFLKRLKTGSPEPCLATNSLDQMIEDGDKACEKSRNIVRNIGTAVDDLCHMKDGLYAAVLIALPEDGSCRQKPSNDMLAEVRNLRSALSDLHLKHKSLANELRKHQDGDLKNKAELVYLREELESVILELEESNHKLAAIKAEKDATKGTFFPVLNMGNKHTSNDRTEDKQKEDLQNLESTLKESLAQSSSRLQELKSLHEERIEILKKLSSLQGTLKNVKLISCASAFKLVKEELEKSKADVIQYQAFFEKLQIEKDKVIWKEREVAVRNDLGDVFRRTLTTASSRIDELESEIQRQNDERKRIEAKLEEASIEPGRKEIISNFKEFVSSFPEDMSSMQSKLHKYKETAADVHALRAEVQSLSNVLARKAKDLETLSSRSADQDAEIQRLLAAVQDLKESDTELQLIVEMYRRESALPRIFLEARDREYQAWAHVHNLKSSLDEHNMEIRVKTAIEAEAQSQQRLAAAEAEIADLREKFESSERDKSKLSNALKSKHEENEAYLSEIETIGQAYDDMQNQNQHLLQQITERDDYNIKLVLEGQRSKQSHDLLLAEKQSLQKKIQQGSVSQDFFEMKAARIEDQVKMCSDQINRHAEDRCQNSVSLENIQRKLLESRKSSQLAKETLDGLQSRVKDGRANLSNLQIELEKERFEKKRVEEELEAVKRKAEYLKLQKEGFCCRKASAGAARIQGNT
uniref:E3 ubiquitin protein ligase n=1 Tax=Chenopodium quinoa TaxID=63459 RepID=A0A803LI99_CHEQI